MSNERDSQSTDCKLYLTPTSLLLGATLGALCGATGATIGALANIPAVTATTASLCGALGIFGGCAANNLMVREAIASGIKQPNIAIGCKVEFCASPPIQPFRSSYGT